LRRAVTENGTHDATKNAHDYPPNLVEQILNES
jgi:hypothetical protein